MRIPLSHFHIVMAQDFLQIIYVSALHHKVGSKCMPEIMEADAILESRSFFERAGNPGKRG